MRAWEVLNRAENRWDATKHRVWKAAGWTPWEFMEGWKYVRVKAALATIGRAGWGADESAADLEHFVPRRLVVEAMDRAEEVWASRRRFSLQSKT